MFEPFVHVKPPEKPSAKSTPLVFRNGNIRGPARIVRNGVGRDAEGGSLDASARGVDSHQQHRSLCLGHRGDVSSPIGLGQSISVGRRYPCLHFFGGDF